MSVVLGVWESAIVFNFEADSTKIDNMRSKVKPLNFSVPTKAGEVSWDEKWEHW